MTDASVTTPLLPTSDRPKTWAGEEAAADAPPTNGTVSASAINLSACALGASMLSLPWTMKLSGPVIALEVLVLFGIMAFLAAQAIVRGGIATRKSTYSAVVHNYFGRPVGLFVDALLSVALMVAAISYIVGLADLLPDMFPFTAAVSRTLRIILTLVVLYPVTLVGSLAAFGPASSFAVAGCYLLAASLVYEVVSSAGSWHAPPLRTWLAVDFSGLVYSLPMICFVYAFHYVQTDTLGELSDPTANRLKNVSLYTVLILLGCYLPVAICGYLLQSGGVTDAASISSNILTDLPPGSASVLIAKWSIGALLLITYSLFIIPLRRKVEAIAFNGLSQSVTDPKRLIVAAALNATVAVISIVLPDLGFANTLAGGCIALIMFFFPGLFMIKGQANLPASQRSAVHIVAGVFFSFVGALICFVGLFGSMIFDY